MLATLSRLRALNIRELRLHWGRALASVGVVAVSAALLVAVLGISGSITGSAARLTESIGGVADLEVSGITDSGFDASLLDAVARVPDVRAAVPIVRMKTRVDGDGVLLIGVDRSVSALNSDLQQAVQDQLRPGSPLLTTPDGVAVGPAIGVATHEQFDLLSTRVTAAVVVSEPPADQLNGGHFVIAPLALAQQIAGRPHRLDAILLVTAPGADVDQVRSAVGDVVAGRAVVASPSFRAAQVSGAFAIMQALTLLLASTSFVVAAYLSYNAMSIAIAQRRPAISTMRALGGRRRMIVGDMLAEAAVLGVAGGVIGAVCGVLVGRVAVGRLPPTLVQSLEAHTQYVLPIYVVPAAIAACVAASVTAAAMAARQIHSVAPVEALAPVGATTADGGSPRVRAAAVIIGVLCLGAVVSIVSADLGRAAVASIGVALVGGTAIAFACSRPLIAAAAAVARWFGSAGVLGAASIERAPRRMWVAVVTVMTAVATAAAVTGGNTNAVDSTLASFSSIAEADVWVSATPATEYPTAPLLPPDTEAAVRAVPGVDTVVPGQMAFATVGDTRLLLAGIAPGSHRKIYRALDTADRARFDAGEGVALSRDVARALDVTPGAKMVLSTPTGERRVEVLAVVPFFSGLTGTMAISLPTMQDWFARPGATDLDVTVAPGADPAAVQAAIRAAVPEQVYVYSGREALAGISKALDTISAVIAAIAWIVVAVSAIALLNTLMLSVLDRRREIGVLRAIGATRRDALFSIAAEAVGIGVIGGLLGLLIGAGTQYLIAVSMTSVLSIDVVYRPQLTMIVIGLSALMICLLGSVPPALRAARLNIVDAVSVD